LAVSPFKNVKAKLRTQFLILTALFLVLPSPAGAAGPANDICAAGFGDSGFNGTHTYHSSGSQFGGEYWENGYSEFVIQTGVTANGNTLPGHSTIYYKSPGSVLGSYDALSAGPGGTVTDGACYVPPVLGCMDPDAENYDPDATEDDGSCTYPTPPGGNFGDLITNASEGAETTIGFNVAGVASWAGTNLISLFIGSGLAVIYNLRFWLVALAIIGAIIFFAYRAFIFFRH
jgi:hypothetical protein